MARRILAGLGRVLISAGVLLLLFVAYQLWGTNLSESHAQTTLKKQFTQLKAKPPGTTPTTAPALVTPGYAIGIITIPKIHLQKYLVEGTGETDLQKGPGHYEGTPLPGQVGNVAIAGHRTTYGAPFYNLNELVAGDLIRIQTVSGTFDYSVTGSQVVAPDDVAVVGPTKDARLTLTTCNPRFSASTRLVVSARLTGTPIKTTPTTTPARPTSVARAAPDNLTAGGPGGVPSSIGWGLGAAAVALAVWLLARRFGWGLYFVGAPGFLVVLFFFYENVSRLLPASV